MRTEPKREGGQPQQEAEGSNCLLVPGDVRDSCRKEVTAEARRTRSTEEEEPRMASFLLSSELRVLRASAVSLGCDRAARPTARPRPDTAAAARAGARGRPRFASGRGAR